MLVRQLFDLVAPIAIYHRADLLFLRKATRAWAKIKKDVDLQRDWRSVDCDPPDITKSVDDLNDWAKETYDILFLAIVLEVHPCWDTFHDRYGAKGIKDDHGRVVFSGDSGWEYPWYETAELLIDRMHKHCCDA